MTVSNSDVSISRKAEGTQFSRCQESQGDLAHIPKKKFGQHFLRDDSVLRQIIELSELVDNAQVLEIGADDGTLTRALPALETSRLEVLAGALAETEAYPGGDT